MRFGSGVFIVIAAFWTVISIAKRRRAYDIRDDATNATKHLWMVNHYAVSEDMPGGTRHVDLAKFLQRYDWHTTIFASSFNHNSHQLVRSRTFPWLVTTESRIEAEFKWIPTFPYDRNNWRRYANMVSFTMKFICILPFQRRPDVVIGSSAHLLAAFGAWIGSRWYGVPFVLEIRDVWPDSLIQLGLSNRLVIALLSGIERFLYRRAAMIIAVSDGIAERIVAKGVIESKVVVIAHGIADLPILSSGRRKRLRDLRGWNDKIVVIWAGSLQPFNGLDTLVAAFCHLQDMHHLRLVFIGNGSERETLVDLAEGDSRIEFHRAVPKTEINDWLISADIGALTSRKFEAFSGVRPRKLFDYMAASLPIVCTVPGEAWEIVHEADAGVYAEWENPIALASAIRELSFRTDQMAQMGHNGRAAVETVHSIERSAEMLEDRLSSLLMNSCLVLTHDG